MPSADALLLLVVFRALQWNWVCDSFVSSALDSTLQEHHDLQSLPQQSNHRRKFRSQTCDNMDRWKSRGGKSQGGEEKK